MIKALNGIRTILLLIIFGAHFKYVIIYSELGKKFFDFFNIGRFALLSFILLSGFCMALGYSNRFGTITKESYITYIKKRFIKFYPLYLISGIIGLIFIYLPQSYDWLYIFITSYIPMLAPWTGQDAGGNNTGWFLSVIFFCYLWTPLAIYIFNKKLNLKFHIIFCAINYIILAIFSLVLVSLHDANNEFLFRFPPIRLLEYLIALDVGFIFLRFIKNKIDFKILDNYYTKSLIDLLFLVLFIKLVYSCPNNLLYRHTLGMPLVCLFFIYMCIEKRSLLYDFFTSKFCDFVSYIGFECYLIHNLVFSISLPWSTKFIYSIPQIIFLYHTLLLITIIIALVYKKTEKFLTSKFNKYT